MYDFFFLQIKGFYCFLKDTFCYCFFYPINLIVAYPLNEKKPRLIVTFENWAWEVAKQLLNFILAISKHVTLATYLMIKNVYVIWLWNKGIFFFLTYKTKVIHAITSSFFKFCWFFPKKNADVSKILGDNR